MNDGGLDTLLAMDGSIVDQGNGYWFEIRAWSVMPTTDIPHGVRYKHRHASDKGVPYEFVSAYQLLADFFAEMDAVLEKEKK